MTSILTWNASCRLQALFWHDGIPLVFSVLITVDWCDCFQWWGNVGDAYLLSAVHMLQGFTVFPCRWFSVEFANYDFQVCCGLCAFWLTYSLLNSTLIMLLLLHNTNVLFWAMVYCCVHVSRKVGRAQRVPVTSHNTNADEEDNHDDNYSSNGDDICLLLSFLLCRWSLKSLIPHKYWFQ